MADASLAITQKQGMLRACFLGFLKPYFEVLTLMHECHQAVSRNEIPSQLLLLEHRPVITITRQHMYRSIKTSEQLIAASGIDLAIADRGGDATFHGPGQLVGYPIIALKDNAWLTQGLPDISRFIRALERSLLISLHRLGFTSTLCLPGFTGIWYKCITTRGISIKKLLAIGVGIKDGVSKHGFALNIDIDHHLFSEHIVPCGLKDRGVITLKEICVIDDRPMPKYQEIQKTISEDLAETFDLRLSYHDPSSKLSC